MNNTSKVLIGLALVFSLIGWILPNVDIFGGTTNYDTLQLTPARPADNALDVRNSTGTSVFIIDGSGDIIATGTLALSGTLSVGGTMTVAAITATGDLTLTGAFIADSIGSGILTITNGGGGNTTSTLTAADVCTAGVANWLATGVATVTFPSAATLQTDCLNTGGYRDLIVRNTGVATTSVTFAAGASSTIHVASSTGTSVVEGGNITWLRFVTVTTTQSDANMVEIVVLEPFR